MAVIRDIFDAVGNTPLIDLEPFCINNGVSSSMLAKAEWYNPAGSAKDRVARQMILDGESSGAITKDSVIIEPTSGNTGIALAALAVRRGYRVIIVMPESMSEERKTLIRAYGAELVLTDAVKGMVGAIERAEELKRSIPNAVIAGQFTSLSNPRAHYLTTGPEIWRDTDGSVDIFVACVGTGGSVSGVGKFLKEQNKSVKIVAVEPSASAVLSGGRAGAHAIQGIGAGFVPEILDRSVIDEVVAVSDAEAFEYSRGVANATGFLVGISSGAAACAAVKIAKREENKDKKIVVLFPDSGDRYLSTALFAEKE